MEGKDDRSKAKRTNMKHYRKLSQRSTGHTSSSSGKVVTTHGIVDVADSSDERFNRNRAWNKTLSNQREFVSSEMDLDDDSVSAAQMRAADFEIMSKIPLSIGGHFQFASEKNWNSADVDEQLLANTEASEYFTLNIKLLNAGLQTIPFYKRMEYPTTFFTREQIKSMDNNAEIAEKNYQNILIELENNTNDNNVGQRSSSAKSEGPAKKESNVENNNAPDELDEFLNMATTKVAGIDLGDLTNIDNAALPAESKENVGDNKVSNVNDIQEWLDNVLEE